MKRNNVWLAAMISGLVMAGAFAPVQASSHREAPFLTNKPKVDGTDFCMFRSYAPGRDNNGDAKEDLTFVGQRKEPFYIAVGNIFDLFNLDLLGPEVSGNQPKNVVASAWRAATMK